MDERGADPSKLSGTGQAITRSDAGALPAEDRPRASGETLIEAA
jgi:hypothetical protein